MNFFDTFDAARPATPNPQASSAAGTSGTTQPEQPSLNEEVNQVIGHLGRFWGGFRKQSQSALEAARKDLGDVVVQAQKELTKLASPITTTAGGETSAAGAGARSTSSAAAGIEAAPATENEKAGGASASAELGAGEASSKPEPAKAEDSASSGGAEAGPSASSPSEDPSSAPNDAAPAFSSSTNTLFARLQSALPPNIVAAVQNNITALHIPESLESLKHASETSLESLKHASEAHLESLRSAAASAGSSATASANASAAAAGIDLAGLRTNLLSELQRVQGLTLAQAEEYAHKSEALLRDAVKEAGEVLREAVKVIPPEEAAAAGAGASGSGSTAGPAAVLWDGTEMWLLPETSASASASSVNLAASTSTTKSGLEASANAVKTRAEALLLRLKQDPDILRHDPEAEEGVRDRFQAWKEKEVDTVEGGIEGTEWKAKIKEAVENISDGAHLRALEDTLVPSEMTHTTFWLRYFFRAYQIRSEEAKRQALLQSSTENDDDFSWEDDEEDASSPVKATPSSATPSLVTVKAPAKDTLAVPDSKDASGSGANSPTRLSSEDSFDLVSGASSTAGDLPPAPRAAATTTGAKTAPKKEEDDDDDGDSDWE